MLKNGKKCGTGSCMFISIEGRSYCKKCDAEKRKLQWHKKPDKADDKFYQSTQWQKKRSRILKQNPLCKNCNDYGQVTEAEIVDHITPINHGGNKFDNDNLQALCKSCHQLKTAADRRKYASNRF